MKIGLSGEKQLFELVSGFTITEEFNETLDNSKIIVRANKRLNIKPYDECCFENGLVMLVDNFVETQESLETEQYLYTISLMSLTKLLEKIQLPNKMITHSLVSGQKTIMTYINEYLELYSPKIRVVKENTWETKQLIENKLPYAKYNIHCRDLGFSKPTLRQALTTLMLQVGCIPVLKKNQATNEIELHDIDFRAKGNNITQLDNYCNYITRSNASDSFVNTLKIVNENVLDEGLVQNELIGFRDTNNVFLKQKENLKLETRFPIYNVNKLYLNVFLSAKLTLIDTPSKLVKTLNGYTPTEVEFPEDGWTDITRDWIGFYIGSISSGEKTITVYKNSVSESTGVATRTTAYRLKLTNVVINELILENNVLKVVKTSRLEDADIDANATGWIFHYEKEDYGENAYTSIVADLYWEYGNYSGTLKQFATTKSLFLNPYIPNKEGFNFLYQKDITKLCIEESKRQLLDTDFLSMENASNLDELSQYIYGTVGYKIGSNVISGFSQTYDKAVGWWSNDYTYIENIFNVIRKQNSIGDVNYEYFKNNALGGLPYDLLAYDNTTIDSVNYERKPFTVQLEKIIGGNLLSNIFFSIEYQALNKTNIAISKEDVEINIPIEQYDSSENSITNGNDLIQVEQQKVDRLGNDVITINQRIPLGENNTGYNLNDRIFGEYVIFKKETQYNPYDIQIVYTASKDYVLQNFFTAIQTKYRAYEYVAYGQSVLRQENTKVNVLIDKFAIYNDNDKVNYFSNWLLLSAIQNGNDYADYKFKYVIKTDTNYGYKEDLSIITAQNNILFTNIAFDSISHGIFIRSTIYDNALGGLPQQWYIKSSAFLQAHTTYYVKEFPIFDKYFGTEEEIQLELDKAYKEPRVNLNATILNSPNTNKKYNLDQQEKLNETLQFEYFTTSKTIKWSNLLQELCYLVNDKQYTKVIYFDNDINVNERPHTANYLTDIDYYVIFNNTNNSIRIKWDLISSEYNVIKFALLENGQVRDILSVGRENSFVYVSLLNTKSLKVGSYRNGCLVFDEYEIAKNNVNKIVNRL